MRLSILKLSVVCVIVCVNLLLIFFVNTSDDSRNISKLPQKSHRKTLIDGVVVQEKNITNLFNFTFTLSPNNICDGFSKKWKNLLIFVASSATNFENRKVIRESWGLRALQEALNYRIVFVLGSPTSKSVSHKVINESWTFLDIIQLSSLEIYGNIAFKSIAYLKWFSMFCNQTDFIFKTDDDIFIHVPNLWKMLLSRIHNNDERSILCHENKFRKIIKKDYIKSLSFVVKQKFERYAVEHIQGTHYPSYCSGFGYAFNSIVAHKLRIVTEITPYFFLEDVYITGFCRQKAGLRVMNSEKLTLRPAVDLHSICLFTEGRVTSQEMNANKIKELWKNLNTRGYICPTLIGLLNRRIST